MYSSSFILSTKFGGGLCGNQFINHTTYIAVQEIFERIQSQTDSVVGNSTFVIIISSDTLASVTCTNLRTSCRSDCIVLFALFYIKKLSFQHFHRLITVLKLTTLFLTLNDYS